LKAHVGHINKVARYITRLASIGHW